MVTVPGRVYVRLSDLVYCTGMLPEYQIHSLRYQVNDYMLPYNQKFTSGNL